MLNYHEATLTMIDYEGNKYQPEPHKPEQPKPKHKADPETLAYLESLPWRPFDVEW